MEHKTSAQPITFAVQGQALPVAPATRGGPAPTAVGGGFGGRGQVLQKVQLGARRSSGHQAVRLSARPGLDAVVLHIANGPSLMLHPETARDLMLAQSGLTRSATRSARSVGDGPADVEVPAQLEWQGLERAGGAGATRGATRGRLGQVLLSGIEIVTGLLSEPAARLTAGKIGAHVDAQVDPGVYRLNAGAFGAPLKGSGQKLDRIPAAPAAGDPVLVLLHGTFSETQGTFGKLWQQHPQKVRELFAHYGDRVYGLDHPTLTASPIDNALLLARALPDGARLHLLTHSRGGLVAEVLARVCAQPQFDAASLAAFKDPAYKEQYKALRDLAAELKGRDIRVERMVRVACPARGTLLASKRLDAYVSVLKWSLELAGIPVAPTLIDFIGEVASQRTDPALLPGLEAMTPDSPLVQWLHSGESPLPGQLRVVAGDIEGDSVMSWVKTLLADAFYWTDNDLVVQTRSMYGGGPRAPMGGHAVASFLLDQGGKVTHFAYFSNPRTAEAVCNGLTQDTPAGFRPIGPMSWAGSSSDGLRGAPRSADVRPASSRPAVILLPGILGSHLSVDGQRVWLSMRILGGLGRLAYREGAGNVLPDGAMGRSYDDLADFLSTTHEVIEFSFDWRRPIEQEARRLAEVLDQALAARNATGQPVHLLAHSMGGLVARTVQLERPEVWQRWLQRSGSRLLMLGTPNGGSFAPMQVLSGDDSFGNALAAFGLPFQDHKARQLMADMPGFIQLQAGLLDEAMGLQHSQRWQALAEQDAKAVAEANWWHHDDMQRSVYRWGVPSQAVLDQAIALRRRLDQQRAEDLPGFSDRVLLVVGRARFTPAGYELNDREGLFYLDAPDDGDGRVTRESALLPGVKTWKVDCEHGDLADAEDAFEAYRELLTHGSTERLPPLTVTRGGPVAAALVRSRPSRQISTDLRPPIELSDVFRLSKADSGSGNDSLSGRPPSDALAVTIHNGNLRFVSTALMVGHYSASILTGTEAVVDRFIGGTMSASLALGVYPEAPGTHQFFVNQRQDPENPLSLPRPAHVLVVGLGQESKLNGEALELTVRQATMAWAQRVAETSHPVDQGFELTATLIGSGGVGVSVAASAQAIVEGAIGANEKLRSGGWPELKRLHLIELYLDRATEAWNAIHQVLKSRSDAFRLTPTIQPGIGALRRPLDLGYRSAGYDFVSAISEMDEQGQPFISYSMDTKLARSEVRAQKAQAPLVRELVDRLSNGASHDPQIGRTLFQLLVPVDLEATLRGISEVRLEVNDGTASIPWEILDLPIEGSAGSNMPWAIENKLLRTLRTVEFRSSKQDARMEDAALVIGEPLCDPALYPPLPGAREEASAVVEALSTVISPEKVKALISPGDDMGHDAAAVTNALLARPYRIVHIAGHGEPELMKDGMAVEPRGVVLSNGAFFGPIEVAAMRVVPELVFLNCCHLAADPRHLLKGYDRAAFAASVAKQFIRIGVRCVVAAGWAVEDDAALIFAYSFYQALMSGQRFSDAVQAGRKAAWEANRQGSTWAAYQCYGDPDWVWQPAFLNRAPMPAAADYAGIASPVALTLALETLAVGSATQGAQDATQREKIRHLEARFEADWGGMGAVAEAFGVACAAARDIENAIRWYRRAVAANDGSTSVKASEQLANLGARLGWERVDRAHRQRKPATALKPLIRQGREDIQQAITLLQALVTISPTMERESLLGSAHKRLHLLESAAGQARPATLAAQQMALHYQRAETLARQTGHPGWFYPALNRMAAELVAHAGQHAGQKPWNGFDSAHIAQLRQCLEDQRRNAPDFWSVVGLPELATMEALASGHLARQLPAIAAVYEDLHQRAGTAWMWASVADQAGFVLRHFSAGDGAEPRSARELLATLQGYAKA